jgi:hypothetical protein
MVSSLEISCCFSKPRHHAKPGCLASHHPCFLHWSFCFGKLKLLSFTFFHRMIPSVPTGQSLQDIWCSGGCSTVHQTFACWCERTNGVHNITMLRHPSMDKIRDTLPISFRYCGVLNQEWCDTFLLVQTVEAVSISTNSYTQLPYFRHMCVWSELYCILCRHSLKTKDRQIKMGIPPLKFPFAERESGSVPEQGRCACLINHGFSLKLLKII